MAEKGNSAAGSHLLQHEGGERGDENEARQDGLAACAGAGGAGIGPHPRHAAAALLYLTTWLKLLSR